MEAEGRRSYLPENRKQSEQNLVYKVYWVPAWEREFTVKNGGLAWERFVEAKKHIDRDSKVMLWNDSAGEEAFHEAKNRFWFEYNRPRVLDECSSDYWYSKFQQDVDDESLMLISKEEFSQNGGTNNGILNFMFHPVAKIKHYTVNKLLPRTAALLS
ncbi:hypothetical protein POM88_032023 [Heracleum sosnowskyi]|uniref:Uncharacterized protein n=1 Tax=Heracleum sosnowskyi TaxID=360622 RepID=A0AAD8HZC3_9APIA|nr:hypothetical protein POM88_032023 [Heracleum sosnowskyi]